MKLFISLLLPQLAGFVGSIFTISAIPAWYATLNKPSFSPPNWLFGPVWTTLYILMGISLYLVWSKGKQGLMLFKLHLVVNALWSILFFGLRSPILGLVAIIILWIMILALVKIFWKIDRLASILLWPYLVWVSFATVLNFAILVLNV